MIRQSRSIAGDEVGVRAYSTAIAAIRAFPRPLRSAADVTALPGCDGKMAALFEAWKASDGDDDGDDGGDDGGGDSSTNNDSGGDDGGDDGNDARPARRTIPAVRELQRSPTFRALAALAGIWGVGPETARTLYYRHGLRSRDQVAAQHWARLSRVQQIGVKFYDELRAPIARPEMERVASRIAADAAALAPGTQCLLVGGYRRGQAACHDIDVLLSHPVEGTLPANLLWQLLLRLEAAHLITHTLLVSTPSQGDGRGGAPGGAPGDSHWAERKGGLFDGLDKALVVWQTAPGQPHRRVDIVVAPTVAAGTALLGWTGGTVFQRDLRLYCEKERGWRFASDGVRCGAQRVAATAGWRQGETWADVERRVMEAIGVGWRPPEMRCTG